MRAWLRWRRDLWRLNREAADAYERWMRAKHTYHDTTVVFSGQPGVWGNAGAVGKAQAELMDRISEYQDLTAKIDRMREVGPQ